MKNKILEYIEKMKSGVSMAELHNHIEGFKGEYELYSPKTKNVVLWSGISKKAADAISELLREKKITMTSTTPLVYYVDGNALDLPILKSDRIPKKPHWLPVVFAYVDA